MQIVSIATASIFLVLSGIHFYWAVFGIKKPELVFPIKDSIEKAKLPSPFITILVGLGLLFFALVFVNKTLHFWRFEWLYYVQIGIGALFLIRAIGEFKYVGFFKSIKETPFARMDTKFYAPLCLLLSVLITLSILIS